MTAFDPTKLADTQSHPGESPAGNTAVSSNPKSPEQKAEQPEGQTPSCPGYFKETVYAGGDVLETVGVPCDHDNDRCKRLRNKLAASEAGFESKGASRPYIVNNVDCGNTTITTLSNIGQDNSKVYVRLPKGLPRDREREPTPKPGKDAANSRCAEEQDQSSTGDASCPGYNTRVISKRDSTCETLVSPCKHDNKRCEKLRRDKFGERKRDDSTNLKKPSQRPSQRSSPDSEEARRGTAGPGGHNFSYGYGYAPAPPYAPGWTSSYAPYPYGAYTAAGAYAYAGYGGFANATTVTSIGSNNVYNHVISNVGNINTVEREGGYSAKDLASADEGRRIRDEGKRIRKEAKRLREQARNVHEGERMPYYPPAPGWGAYPAYGIPSAYSAPSSPFPPPPSPYFNEPGPSQWYGASPGGSGFAGDSANVNLGGPSSGSSRAGGFAHLEGNINGKYVNRFEEL
ncbi:unnamed protein product [Cyclocybe aegerita]|uniref:Uncharacterized protein n=1 Tax=Cyclocybe aegerita TaxID=1973307 RepID=A0A8S0X0S6_CYCAE|nr:unnamed protein product [Cyclocybe aegerita]